MANNRVYDEVIAPVINAVSMGGMTSIETTQDYMHNVDSQQDGVGGPSDADEAGQQVKVSIASTDVLQLIPLLIATPTAATWYGFESGASTFAKGSLVAPVLNSGRFNVAKGGYATINVAGQCRFPDAAATFDDVEGFVRTQNEPAQVHPQRLWQPGACTHDALAPNHLQSLGFALNARLMVDYDSGDMGTTAVDRAEWGLVEVELVIRDSSVSGNSDMATALMNNGVKDLVVALTGVGDTPDKTLTLRNCKFRSKRKIGGRDWSGHALSGVLQWRDLTGAPPTIRTLDDATPANRLINFA